MPERVSRIFKSKLLKPIESGDMEKLEHIGIAVKNLRRSQSTFRQLCWGSRIIKLKKWSSEGVKDFNFFDSGGVKEN